jgi:hypothetical protein
MSKFSRFKAAGAPFDCSTAEGGAYHIYVPTFPARGKTNKRESASTFTFQIAEHALHDDVRSLRAGGASAAATASESTDLDGGPGAVVPQSPIKSRLPSVHRSFTRHVGMFNTHTHSLNSANNV